MKTESQEAKILEYLKAGNSLTSLQALELFSTLRLSGRIHSLIKQGNNITSKMITLPNKKRVAEYRLTGQTNLFESKT